MTKSVIGLHEKSTIHPFFLGVRVYYDGRAAVPLEDYPSGDHPDWEFIEMDDDEFFKLPEH